jgi:hypothetical protein
MNEQRNGANDNNDSPKYREGSAPWPKTSTRQSLQNIFCGASRHREALKDLEK